MEINVSRKKITQGAFIAVLLVFLTSITLGVAHNQELMNRLFPQQTKTQIAFDIPAEHRVLSAVATIYAPPSGVDQETWLAQVCTGMSQDGCQVFKQMFAPTVWAATQQNHVGADDVNFVEDVDTLDDGRHVWKLQVTVFEGQEGGEYNEHQFDVYVEVSQDTANEWVLDRILFDQEVKERYASK